MAYSGINEYFTFSIFYQQTTHGPVAQILLVGRINAIPDYFGQYPKHGSTIQFKVTGVDYMQFRFVRSHDKRRLRLHALIL